MNSPIVTDTQPISSAIAAMIRTGVQEQVMLAVVAQAYPELTSAELSAALQDATAAAERLAVARWH